MLLVVRKAEKDFRLKATRMNHHNSLRTVVNLAHYGNVDAAFR